MFRGPENERGGWGGGGGGGGGGRRGREGGGSLTITSPPGRPPEAGVAKQTLKKENSHNNFFFHLAINPYAEKYAKDNYVKFISFEKKKIRLLSLQPALSGFQARLSWRSQVKQKT